MPSNFLENNLAMTVEEWLRYHQEYLHFHQTYRGLQMIKNPFDLLVYEEILWETKPTVIIEIGSWKGGSALWLCDRMRIIGVRATIITIDITQEARTNLSGYAAGNLVTLVGDCNDSKILSQVRAAVSTSDRVLIIEDSAHTMEHTLRVLENYSAIVTVGSYLIVEDGICDVLHIGPQPGPMRAVERWVCRQSHFQIDRTRERYIMTYNPKGFLKRVR